MNEKKKTRLFARILTTVVLTGLLSTTAFAGSPQAQFQFNFPWGSDTQYSDEAQKTDAGTNSGQYADIYATQETKVTYTVVKKDQNNNDVVYTSSHALYSEDYEQHLSLNYTRYVVNYTYFQLRGESDWGRYGTAGGKWYP